MTFAQPFSEYEVIDRVGAGSMGTVFKARHKKLDRIVALKVLKPSLARDTRYVDRLRREARIVASLNHPNIVTGYDLGQEGGYHFFVMEFIEGKSLRELLDEWGIFAEERVLDVAVQITIALDHAFKKGVIHRDIKPANILIDGDNVVKLTDMGLAKGPDNLTITRDGATVGTPQYISPEQARDPQDADVRSDLYSLGATLYHMCTGQPPFRAETMANVLIKVLQERAPSAAGFNPELSDGLNLILRKLLSKDPSRRYQTPAELLDDLRRVQRAEPPQVEEKDLDRGEVNSPLRQRLLLSAIAIVLLVAGLWGGHVLTRDPEVPVDMARLTAEFNRTVQRELRDQPTVGAKINRVRQLQALHKAAFEREMLAAEMHGLANQLEVEILLLMRQEEEDLLTTFARLSWNNTQRDLEAGIEDRIAGEVGLRVAQLSGPALESYRERWGILAARLGEHIKDREQRFCRGVDDLKNDVLQQLTARLVLLDFASAETALRGGLRRFDALEGVPATSALPASLADYLAKAKAATAAAGEEQIDTREGEIVASFEAALEEDLPEVSETLQSGDPQAAMARLDALVDNLRRSFPERSFREAANPWRIASGRIERLRNQITLALQRSRATEWSKTLQHAYEIVLSGDLATAKTELQYRAKGLDPARAEPHLRLLDHALAVRRQLLTRLLRTAPKRRVKDIRMRGGGEVHVEVVRRGEGVSLQIPDQTDRNSTIPLAMLRVRDLVARAPDFTAELDADLRAGLALWFLLSGDTDVATLLAGGTFGALFREELIPLSESLSPPEQARLESYQTLVKLRDAVAQHDWATAQALLASLREDPQVAQTWEDELRDHARKIGTGIEEQDLHSRLRAAVLVGGEYKLLNRALTLTYDLRKTGFDPLPAGWQRDAERCIAYTERDARLGVAEALTFDSSCSIERALRVDLDLRLGVEAGAPRLFFLTLHGASVGLGLRGDGVVVGVPVARGLRATKELQEQIQKALRQSDDDPAFIVPGALHRLTVEARPQGGKVVVLTVSLDQREVFSGSVIRPSERDSGRVAVTALQPLTLQSLVVTGTVR